MSNEFVTRAETAAENAQLAANQATEAMNATAADRQAVEELVSTIDTTQLPSIQASKEAIRNAIVEQGQECDETVAFTDYADKILAIETGVDVSDADSVTGADIRADKKVYGSDGTLVTGTLAEVTAERVDGTNQVQVPAGIHEDQTIEVGTVYSGDTTITPGESAVTIAADTLLLDGLTVAAVIDSGSSDVSYGYLNSDGLMQPIDISGDTPVDSGDPISIDLKVFQTGKPLPEYPTGGGSMDFYKCAAVYGPSTGIRITVANAGTTAVNGDYAKTDMTTESGGEVWKHVSAEYYMYPDSYGIWALHSAYPPTSDGALYYCYDGVTGSWSTGSGSGNAPTVTKGNVTIDADVPKTWDGYKAVFNAESEIWSFDAAVTTGLTFGENIVPAIGKIYNDTATLTALLYQGYPENALLINCDTLDDDRFTATNCTLSTDIKKYGTGSIKINSNGYIEFDHGAESLTDIPWTAAHFFYADSYTGGTDLKPLVNNDTDAGGSFFVAVTSDGKIRTHIRGGSASDTQDTLSDGWHHIRVVHNGGTLKAYLDGNLIATVSVFQLNTDRLWIGKLAGSGSRQFDGYIDGIEFIPLDELTIAKYIGDTAPVPAKSF